MTALFNRSRKDAQMAFSHGPSMAQMRSKQSSRIAAFALASLAFGLAGCSTLGGAGPSADQVRESAVDEETRAAIQIVELDRDVAARLETYRSAASFAQTFGASQISSTIIGPGDILDIAIWEAPPAALFGATMASSDARAGGGADLAQNADIPQQQVGEDGKVSVPFIGRISVAGSTPQQVEEAIVARLSGRANDPQALVRLTQNESRTVTVLGAVSRSGRMVLSARGERVLDALADAGGSSEAVDQSTIQIARGSLRAAMPLESIIADPEQNIGLRPGDVITVQHQPFSFVALGAVTQNAEIPFEGAGINLAEALGRVGGLNDRRADVKGVFVFRMEPLAVAENLTAQGPIETTADGRVPVIYSLRMTDAQSLFAMQDFAMRDGDILYIATAPGVEIERFISTLSSTAFSIVATANAIESP